MALSEGLLERSYSSRLRAGGCSLGLVAPAPLVVAKGQDQVFAAAPILAGLATALEPKDVNLMAQAGARRRLDEVAIGCEDANAGLGGGAGGRGGYRGELFPGCAAVYTRIISLRREKVNSQDGYNPRL